MRGRYVDVEQLNDVLSSLSARCFVIDREGAFIRDGDREAGGASTANVFEAYGREPHASAELQRLLSGSEVAFTVKEGSVEYEVRAKPLRDAQGRPDGAIGVARVVAHEQRSQSRLLESEDEARRMAEERQRHAAEAQLRHAVDQAPFILWALDMNGVFTLAEGQGLAAIGRKRGEAVGHSAFELYKDLPDVIASLRRALAGEAFSYVSTVRGRVFETRTFPLRDPGGALSGFSAVSLDVTERQRAELERAKLQTQLLEGQKLESLGLLAGGIAHDFNNILTVILGSAHSASLRLPEGSPAREEIDSITAAGRRAADLTHQMLAYSGKAHFEIKAIDLSEHVHEITTLLEMTVSKKARLDLSVARDLPAIFADSAQIQQVIMNLVLNAAEAIGDRSGTVRVTTGVQRIEAGDVEAWCAESSSPGEYVFVEVSDSGAGMDPATQAKIFDPFFTTKFAGRGLGLSAVLGIVRAHKGAIRVDSVLGTGSTFRVVFPSAGPKQFRQDARAAAYRGRGLALLIDDDAGVRKVVRDMLGRLGFSVTEAVNGRHGLTVFRELRSSVAVVVLDMTMPEMNGEETYREIRAFSDVPIVLISGYAEFDSAQRFANEPTLSFLHKPFTQQELSQKLKAAFEGSGRADRLPANGAETRS